MPVMSGAQALVRSLARHGVEVVFGLPGVQIMDIFDALYDEPGIRMVLTRHEQATTYMADGYARTTGKPGVALVVPGPGALNATAGLGTAYATSSPVLLVSGQIESYNLGQNRGALHEIGEQLDVFKHLTKWCGRSDTVNEIPGMVRNAFREMSSGRPRPVEIEIPWDVLPMTDQIELPEPEGPGKQQPEPALIREAAQLLAGASRPLIWAGGGTREAAVSSELLDLAGALNSPVITTPEGKGAIPENSSLSLGSFYYAHGPGHIALPQADVILAVGSRMLFTPNVPWGIQSHQKVVQIDADPEELGRNIPATVGISADARLGVQALLEELGGRTRASQWTETEITAIRQQADGKSGRWLLSRWRSSRRYARNWTTTRSWSPGPLTSVTGVIWPTRSWPRVPTSHPPTSPPWGMPSPRPWAPKSATPAGRSLPQRGMAGSGTPPVNWPPQSRKG